jgi:hypothetical protein
MFGQQGFLNEKNVVLEFHVGKFVLPLSLKRINLSFAQLVLIINGIVHYDHLGYLPISAFDLPPIHIPTFIFFETVVGFLIRFSST